MKQALTQAQIDTAYRLFYGDGKNMGDIAKDLGCSIYALSPWLYAPATRFFQQGHEDHIRRTRERLADPVHFPEEIEYAVRIARGRGLSEDIIRQTLATEMEKAA